MAAWLRADGDGSVVITLHVQPGARSTEIVGLHGDALKLKLAAPPVDGKANDCLIAFLAGRIKVAKSSVDIVTGHSNRRKRVRVRGAAQLALEALLVPATES